MEVIEEPSSVHNSVIDEVKVNNIQCNEPSAVELDVIAQKSNGVNECIADQCSMEVADTDLLEKAMGAITDAEDQNVNVNQHEVTNSLVDTSAAEIIQENVDNSDSVTTNQQNIELISTQNIEPISTQEVSEPIEPGKLVTSNNITEDQVTFQTEIYIEKNGDEIVEDVLEEQVVQEGGQVQDTSNILTHITDNIELNEALQLSDVNAENNNSSANEEVFNKEELLDILEGNNEEPPVISSALESHIALQQLTRLQAMRGTKRGRGAISNARKHPKANQLANKSVNSEATPEKGVVEVKKRGRKKKVIPPPELPTDNAKNEDNKLGVAKQDKQNPDGTEEKLADVISEKKPSANTDKKLSSANTEMIASSANSEQNTSNSNPKQNESILSDLVQDWEDEPLETESNAIVEGSQNILQDTDQLVQAHETVIVQEESLTENSGTVDTVKSEDDNQPQRRQSRVIKKKVIFDPDNPDTFTKGKISKKDVQTDNEQTPKKVKTESNILRSKSKSPTGKMQWKKPCPKNSKQNKRTTEIDRLLMDEGAVNMIYQLTPEAPKGGKNTRTKAEFIKKIQNSKQDSKEMKFRERKKEIKTEENEPKKVASGKRSSVSSSVKSAAFEDFENHSADDSIIYRRHSSSSYSSTCMSPRRLSDVEAGCMQSTPRIHQTDISNLNNTQATGTEENTIEDIFMADSTNTPDDIINKDACLSIKQKLNSKLSLALNKRKRESSKSEKPVKQKRLKKVSVLSSVKHETVDGFEYLSISFDQRLAEICIKKTGSKYDVETIKELERALLYVDTKKDISVTFLSSECGSLCSNLDLTSILDNSMERRTNVAYEIAESIRCLLCSVNCHSKLLCTAVFGPCSGISLPLLVLSDIAMASEFATFKLTEYSENPPVLPGVAILSQPQCLPQSMLHELVILGRQLSSSEALRGGIVNRTLWPDKVIEQGRAIAKDISLQPSQNIILKKQLLTLHKRGEAEGAFLSALEAERDLLVEYWTSVSGQEMLRAALNSA